MLTENQLFANRYRLVKRLGQGAFSEVWKAEDTETGNLTVALKVYAPDKGLDEDGAKIFSEEFAIVFNVHHSNLLTPTYYAKESNSPYLVLPFCEQGSSTRLIGKMSEQQVAQFLHDVSSALAYLHAKDIIHQDIKPDNVLIDGEGNYMVTDFGISTRIRSTLRKSVGDKKSSGTMAYMGPERFSRTPQTIKASDIWSLGATVYELMSGYPPFNDFGGLSQKGGADIPEVEGDYSSDLKLLVERCLALETWDRPTAAQLRDICDGYLRTRTWDLSSLDKCGTKEPERQKAPVGRPTERKVRTEFPKDTVKQNKEKPAKVQVAMPKMNKKRWIIILSVIVGFWIVSATTLGMVKRAKTTAEAKERQRFEEEIVKRKSEMQSLAKTYTVNGVSFTMIYVEGGTFQMGATSEQGNNVDDDEKPVHEVTLSDFCIGETEVTQALWQAVMGSNPSYFKGDNRPVESMSWNDCQMFIQKLNQLTGRTFRLPTEAEWEYAARGGKYHSGYKYSGSNEVGYVAWYGGNSGSQTHDVKTKQPNALGLYDMSGNVWEWCSDWKGSYSSSAQTNPEDPSSGSYRVLRGGSWDDYAGFCRVSYRIGNYPGNRDGNDGFRLSLVRQ